jgi:hypothetical protein
VFSVRPTPIVTPHPLHQHWDGKPLLEKKEGLIYSGKTSVTQIIQSAGVLTGYGINYITAGALNPNILSVPLNDPVTFTLVYRKAGGGLTFSAPTNTFNPNQYDDGSGTPQPIANPNVATNHYIYTGFAGETFIILGQNLYATLQDAVTARTDGSDTLDGIPGELLKNAINTCILSLDKTATDFSNSAQAVFFTPSAGGSQGVGGGGTTVNDVNVSITSILNIIQGSTQDLVNKKIDAELYANRKITVVWDNVLKVYKVNSPYPFADGSKATLEFTPTTDDPGEPLVVTLDDGATPYNVFFRDARDKQLTVSQVQSKSGNPVLADVIRETTDVIINRTFPISEEFILTSLVQSTKDIINPLDNGTPEFEEIKGLTRICLTKNPNFDANVNNWNSDAWANADLTWDSNGYAKITDNTVGADIYLPIEAEDVPFEDGEDYFIKFKAKPSVNVDNIILSTSTAGAGFKTFTAGIDFVAGEWADLHVLVTSLVVVNQYLRIYFQDASGFPLNDFCLLDYVYLEKISNTLLTGLTSQQISDRTKYLKEDFNDLENPPFRYTGVNLHKETNLEYGSISSATGLDTDDDDIQRVRTYDFISVLPNTNYFLTAYESSDKANSLRVIEYDANREYITASIGVSTTVQFTTAVNTKYVRFRYEKTTGNFDLATTLFQLQEGTVQTAFRHYNSPTPKEFKTTPRSVGLVQDIIRKDNDKFVIDKYTSEPYLLVDADIVGVSNLTNVQLVSIDVLDGQKDGGDGTTPSGIVSFLGYTDIARNDRDVAGGLRSYTYLNFGSALVVPLGTYANLVAAKADLIGLETRYVFADVVTTEIDVDGATTQEDPTTIEQLGNFALEAKLNIAVNDEAQAKTDRNNVRRLKREVDLLEAESEKHFDVIIAGTNTSISLNKSVVKFDKRTESGSLKYAYGIKTITVNIAVPSGKSVALNESIAEIPSGVLPSDTITLGDFDFSAVIKSGSSYAVGIFTFTSSTRRILSRQTLAASDTIDIGITFI